MIVTLTLNPAIDKSTEVEQLIPEKKLRCREMLVQAGGGGINVSKAIKELGGESAAVFPYGGVNGQLLLQLMDELSLKAEAVSIEGNTRESIVVNELSTNREYKFVLPGPSIHKEELEKIKTKLRSLQNISFLICSGSLPPGVPDEFLGEIADIAKEKGIKLMVDTSDMPLKAALKRGVYLIKPNMSELCFLAGTKYIEFSEIDPVVDRVLKESNCEVIVVSMGPSGAMLCTKNFKKEFPAPPVKKMSTVGAGDSMLAGISWMLESGNSLEEAVRFGIACGSAAAVTKGSQLFRKEDALRFFNWVKLHG